MRSPLIFLALVFASAVAFGQQPAPSDASTTLTQEQIQNLFRQVADKDLENQRKQRDYTYIQRQEEHKLDGHGQVKSTESMTSEIMDLYGDQVERLIAKDDKPLSEKEAAKEEEKIRKLTDKRKDESENERRKRLAKEEKDREEGRQFVREVADAYNFHFAGIESLDGRDTYVIDGDPRPGYVPHMKDAKILPKFKFRAWIDKNESQWKKLDLECIDTVSFGLFLARLHKGSRVVVEQTRVNDEVWLPKHVAVKVDVRIALLKNLAVDDDIIFRDYKKFRTEVKVLPGLQTMSPP